MLVIDGIDGINGIYKAPWEQLTYSWDCIKFFIEHIPFSLRQVKIK